MIRLLRNFHNKIILKLMYIVYDCNDVII